MFELCSEHLFGLAEEMKLVHVRNHPVNVNVRAVPPPHTPRTTDDIWCWIKTFLAGLRGRKQKRMGCASPTLPAGRVL